MTGKTETAAQLSDPAAIFAAALSLWQACQKKTDEEKLNLSECYNGVDEFMREVMRVANLFEAWSCSHINFDELNEVWSYVLENRFGEACLAVIKPSGLAEFDDTDCLRVAIYLRLPIILDDKLPVPIDLKAANPVVGAGFREFRIQTIRDSMEDDDCSPFLSDDEPFDPEFGPPYFGLYGIGNDGLLEHIADRRTYREIFELAQKIAPGVNFPAVPMCSTRLPINPHH